MYAGVRAPGLLAASLLGGVGACVPAGDDGAGGPEETGESALPSGWEGDVDPPARADDRSLDELGAMLQAGVDAARELHGDAVFAAYDRALADAGDGCPTLHDYGNAVLWEDDCATGAGATFFGNGTRLTYEGLPTDDGYYSGLGLVAACDVATAGGEALRASGYWYTLAGNVADGEHTYAVLNGEVGWTGAEADGSWIAAGWVPHVRVDGWHLASTGARVLLVDGGVDFGAVALGDAFGGDLVVDYRALTMDSAAGCAAEPSGEVSLRESDGTWYDLVFDPDVACDGCASASRDGRALGLVCASFAGLLDWERRPW